MAINNTTQTEELNAVDNTDIDNLQQIATEYRREEAAKEEVRRQIEREQYEIHMRNERDSTHTPRDVHDDGIDRVARDLIEHGMPTMPVEHSGVDLILDNGNTIAVRSASMKNGAIPLIQIAMNKLTTTHVMIITGVYDDEPAFYILNSSDAKRLADGQYYKKNGVDSWFLRKSDYAYYEDNYTILNNTTE